MVAVVLPTFNRALAFPEDRYWMMATTAAAVPTVAMTALRMVLKFKVLVVDLAARDTQHG